jgi:hypothetical protein
MTGPASRSEQGSARRLETTLVVLIALHSFLVGLFLLFLTRWGAAFGGWGEPRPLFFPRQVGVFHLVVVWGYLWEYFRYRGVTFLVVTKCIAVVFLIIMATVDGGPWVLPVSAVGDGLMGLAVYLLHRRVKRVRGG